MSNDPAKPQPFIVVPPGAISRRDLARLRNAGYLVVTSSATLRAGGEHEISVQDRAAIATAHWLLFNSSDFVKLSRREVRAWYATQILKLIPLSPTT